MDLYPWLLPSASLSPVAPLTLLVLVLNKHQTVLSTKHQPTLVIARHETGAVPIWSWWESDHSHAFCLSGKLWLIHEIN